LSLGHAIAICFVQFHVVHSVGYGTPAAQDNLHGVTHMVPATLCLQERKAIGYVQKNSHVYK
jgi:hypothetical protein